MTAQPTPALGAQPTGRTPSPLALGAQPTGRTPSPLALGAQPTGRTPSPLALGAQPTPPSVDHGRAAQWAGSTTVVLWAVGGVAYMAGCTAQAYAGGALGGAALGGAAAHWAAHYWAGRRARRAAHIRPVEWAPMSAAQARATLRLVAAQSGSNLRMGGLS